MVLTWRRKTMVSGVEITIWKEFNIFPNMSQTYYKEVMWYLYYRENA
jgi:hypothetical protein